MNQFNRSTSDNTEAYTKLFEKLSLAIEQGLAAKKTAKEKEKKRQKLDCERIRTDFAKLEDKALSFNFDALEQYLLDGIDKHFHNKPNEPLTLFTHKIACSSNDIDLIVAKAFRVPFFSLLLYPWQIVRPDLIDLPELRLLFIELKTMHLSPCLSISERHGLLGRSGVEITLTVNPNWHRLKKLFYTG